MMERRDESQPLTAEPALEPDQTGETWSFDGLDPRLVQMMLTLSDDEVIVPLRMKREDVSKLKGLKLSDAEVERVDEFQAYLYDRKYIPTNTFASLFCYLFNVGYTWHRQIAEAEAREEGEAS